MTSSRQEEKVVIAFDIRPRRFGFVVFEGRNRLLDWGIYSFFPRPSRMRPDEKIFTLIQDFSPSAIVVRKRRGYSDTYILELLLRLAQEYKVTLRFVSLEAIRKAFAGAGKKNEVASALAQRFSILMSKLPRRPKCWQSEDYRMSIFDAAAAGVAYFARGSHRNGNAAKPSLIDSLAGQ